VEEPCRKCRRPVDTLLQRYLFCGAVNPTAAAPNPPTDVVWVCPFCEGEVSASATKCRHCGEWLDRERPTSSGNVLAGVASFFIPGLGQLVQGRLGAAFLFFVLSLILWIVLLGWLVHIFSAVEAATHNRGV
jgi:ribosomal protein L40E